MKKWTVFAMVFLGCSLGIAQQTTPATKTETEAALKSGYEISVGGTTRRLEIVTGEVAVKLADGRRDIAKTTSSDMRHAARTQRAKSPAGGSTEVELILTEPVSDNPKERPGRVGRRHFVTRGILVRLKAGATAQDVANKSRLNVAQQPGHAPGLVVLEAGTSEDALAAMEALRALPEVESADVLLATQKGKKHTPNDPFFSEQWHLRNTTQVGGALWIDANLTTAWDVAKGSGIVIGIVDDGVQYTHPDLQPNYNTTIDYDFNGNDADPAPFSLINDTHGTSVAGVAGARGNNGIGVTGSAPLATLTGIRLIAAATTDQQDADAFLLNNNLIHIKSNSWGVPDSYNYYGPGPLATAALETGATSGRGGKGVIYVFASGNGLEYDDNSNTDGYANNPHVIAVTAVNDFGFQAAYAEPGANILIAAPASGNSNNQGVRTTDLTGANGYNTNGSGGEMANTDYTNDFGGTSAAAPLVSGVVALMLEANPNLGWRDVKEILIRTARRNHRADTDWSTNAAGFSFNHKYGAGIVDAAAAVALAQQWTNLPAVTTTQVTSGVISLSIPDNSPTGISHTLNVTTPNFRVEQVSVTMTATHTWVGDLDITLTSPSGMTSKLVRQIWDSTDNMNWTFGSVRHWGESATGNWTLKVCDRALSDIGRLTGFTLKLHGTTQTGARVVGDVATLNLTAEGNTPANTAADPGEAVTFNLGLKNIGAAATSSLTATLLPIAGITSPSAPQNYGALATGGAAARTFSFKPQGGCGTSATLILQLQDGATNLGFATVTVPLGTTTATTFTGGKVTLLDNQTATPYPSVLNVAGLVGRVQRLTYEFNGIAHQRGSDIGLLLQGPQSLKMHIVNGGPSGQINGVTVVFDDNALPLYPWAAVNLTESPYRPYAFNFARPLTNEPAVPLAYTFGEFLGSSPNGAWNLYAQDFVTPYLGSFQTWKLNFTTVTCTDNVTLAQSATSGSEGAGSLLMAVTRTGGLEGSATVNYATSNGTATAGSDYTNTSGTLTFAPGELSKNISIPITNDSTLESNETINVTLSAAGGNTTLGTLFSGTVTIEDNDTVTPVALSPAPTLNVTEAATSLTFTVSRAAAGSAGTVDWSTTVGTASAADFQGGSGTLSFGAADLSKTFLVPVLNDAIPENPETFTVTIQTPTSGLSLGSPTSATVTIVDGDTDGDTLVDDYETSMGLNPAVNDANQDTDRDGLTNMQEFILGSAPNSGSSQFKPAAGRTGNDISLSFPSLTGRTYRVEASQTMVEPWPLLQGNIAGTGSPIVVQDTGGALQGKKFYRVVVTKP